MNKVLMARDVEDQPELIGENPGCTEGSSESGPLWRRSKTRHCMTL